MRVLVVDGFEGDASDGSLGEQVAQVLTAAGNQVEHLVVTTADFSTFMTAAERQAYETDEPLIDPIVRRSAELVMSVDALLFVYPTTLFGIPAALKSWLERVMVLGVAFVFDDKQRVRPGLKNVRRLGAVTTSVHGRRATARARDHGRRTFMRTLRLNCHPLCRRTFVRIDANAPDGRVNDQLARSLRAWRG